MCISLHVTFLTCVLHYASLILSCLLFIQFLEICTFVLHFWLLFYLSEGLIFIPPINLVFARADAGVGGTTGVEIQERVRTIIVSDIFQPYT